MEKAACVCCGVFMTSSRPRDDDAMIQVLREPRRSYRLSCCEISGRSTKATIVNLLGHLLAPEIQGQGNSSKT